VPGPVLYRRAVPADLDAAPDGDVEDRRLLAAHVAGDPEAFGQLVARHRDRLWAVAVRTLSDREEAADALQDALLSAFRGAATFRGDARVTTWLHRVVVNACLDRVRRQQVRPTSPLPEGPHEPVDPDDPLGRRETSLELVAALRALPEEQRVAIVLVDVQGLPVDEAARVLGVPTGTVKSRCSRGRARLAVALGHLRNRPAPGTVPPSTDPTAGPTSGGGTA
jgi:RNA polymerase sigma-70 factor, ECF subfamily